MISSIKNHTTVPFQAVGEAERAAGQLLEVLRRCRSKAHLCTWPGQTLQVLFYWCLNVMARAQPLAQHRPELLRVAVGNFHLLLRFTQLSPMVVQWLRDRTKDFFVPVVFAFNLK